MIGYAFCGSFCTVPRSIKILRTLVAEGNRVLPIMNESVYTTDTRFGSAAETVRTVEEICGNKVLHSIVETEPIGPSVVLVIMIALGYVGADEGNQAWDVAVRMRYLVAGTYLVSAVLQFIGLGVIYNIDKKTLDAMNEALGREDATEADAPAADEA